MRLERIFFLAFRLGLLVMLAQAVTATAAEIKVLSTIGVRSVMHELVPRLEQATGHKLVIVYEVANVLKRRIDAGESFDVAILTLAVTDDLMRQGKIMDGTRSGIARSGNGLAVRAGALKPDISTAEAFKRALLGAKSIAYSKEGASGIYFAGLLQRLGIAAEMKPKMRLAGGDVAELVARGEVEMAVQLIPELIAVNGVELVGPFPPELQNHVVFMAGIGARAREPEAARALIRFLMTPEVIPVIRSKGLEPG